MDTRHFHNFHIIIPARFSSTRLPGKVLLDIQGKPLIQHVYERALTYGAQSITIATDDERVLTVAKKFGAAACMTDSRHENGTERLSEVVTRLNMPEDAVIINVQGDEPLLPAKAVHQAVKAMYENPSASMTTLCTPLLGTEEIFDPNIVKIVLDKNGYALYFSRAPIPWDRTNFSMNLGAGESGFSSLGGIKNCFRHVGLYGYRARTLKKYSAWEKSPLEAIEFLEQLRLLWQGEKIHVSLIDEVLPPGVDTEADLVRLREILENA
jgi:3-deoxy-manno-octulosonate cytidylyltransferase (CMP-KDO synthetase)